MADVSGREKLSAEEIVLLNCGVEDFAESLGLQRQPVRSKGVSLVCSLEDCAKAETPMPPHVVAH